MSEPTDVGYVVTDARFVSSAVKPAHYPDLGLVECAVVGRSNVGKSSLVNALVGRRGLARVSKRPGATQLVNFFRMEVRLPPAPPPAPEVRAAFGLVDLPGYGFAKVPEAVRLGWGPMVSAYLRRRDLLKLLVMLVDIRRDPTEEDRMLLAAADARDLPVLVVLTKADKLARTRHGARRRDIAGALGRDPTHVMVFSALSGQGRGELWRRLLAALGLESAPETAPAGSADLG